MSNGTKKITVTGRAITFSQAVLDRSPELRKELEGNHPAMRSIPDRKREEQTGTLGPRPATAKSRSKRSVVICIEIIALRHRSFDDDNICAGAKHLRDAIAASLGVDDGDKRLRWRYGFCLTEGPEDTLVRVSLK